MGGIQTQCLVIGSGPGGYAAAFRAADLGLSVVLVERYATMGGVCLNVGCIPSKALLHVAEVINDQHSLSDMGIKVGKPTLDIAKIKAHKDAIVKRLTGGLNMLAKKRNVQVVQGSARFVSDREIVVTSESKDATSVVFEQCILATGSKPVKLPFLPDDPRIITSTGALDLGITKGRMLIIGGGIIGCEMATVYNALGMQVEVVEMLDQIMTGADPDLVKPFQKVLASRGVVFHTNTRVTSVKSLSKELRVSFEGNEALPDVVGYDLILQAVGRVPNSSDLDLDKAGVLLTDRGFVQADSRSLRSSQSHIFAIGDIVGDPMLAHKATAQGRVAAEIASGKNVEYDVKVIPSVAYTDPEVAWVGKTEQQCREEGLAYKKGVFPWAANGRAMCYGRDEGMTKILTDKATGRVVGAGIVGRNAGDLIAELGLAIEMDCHIEDIALTVHAHPTLAETVGLAAEVCEGTVTDL